MDQKKIGLFIKELRKEKKLTQEQFAEILGVSNRSISRWENGNNLPDFDLVIEIAAYFDITIDEFLNGERKTNMINEEEKDTILKIADYKNNENMAFSKRINLLFIFATVAFVIYSVLDYLDLTSTPGYESFASYALGLVLGALLVGVLYTSKYINKIKAFKQKIKNKSVMRKANNSRNDKSKRIMIMILSAALFLTGIAFCIAALTGHHAAWSPAICFFAVSVSWMVQTVNKN